MPLGNLATFDQFQLNNLFCIFCPICQDDSMTELIFHKFFLTFFAKLT